MARFKLFIPLLVFVLLASFLYWGLGRDPNAMPSALVDRPVPVFTLPRLDDERQLVTQEVLKGQVTLLNVWATWCFSCRAEHPYLIELAGRGVAIVGLNYKDDGADARAWLAQLGNPYRENIVDRDGLLGLDLGVFGAPETYLVDSEGIIRQKHIGVIDERVWRDKVAPLYESLGGVQAGVLR